MREGVYRAVPGRESILGVVSRKADVARSAPLAATEVQLVDGARRVLAARAAAAGGAARQRCCDHVYSLVAQIQLGRAANDTKALTWCAGLSRAHHSHRYGALLCKQT